MNFGFQEMLVIALIVLILFGGKKLPELARGIGNGIRELRGAMKEDPNASHPNTAMHSDVNAKTVNNEPTTPK